MKKIEFITKPLFISDHEISEYKSFDSLMDRVQAQNIEQSVYHRLKSRLMLGGLLVSLAIVGIYHFTSRDEIFLYQISTYPNPIGPLRSELLVMDTTHFVEKEEVKKSIKSPSPNVAPTIHAEEVEEKAVEKESEVPVPVEDQLNQKPKYEFIRAEPVKGMTNLYEYFNDNLMYPAVTDSIEGQVFAIFTVHSSGEVMNIQIDQSLGDPFDHEAIRLLENMPAWLPAKVNGKPVDSKVSVPIYFKIDKE